MNPRINRELLQIFFADARDCLDLWEKHCLKLRPDDKTNVVEPLLHCAHNLKGGAGLIGLQTLQQKLHRFEDFLVEIRDQSLVPGKELVTALLQMERVLRSWIEGLKGNLSHTEDTSSLEAAFVLLLAGTAPRFESVSAQAESVPRLPEEDRSPDETLRVSVFQLDKVIQLVGELSLHHAVLERSSREGRLASNSTRDVIEIMSNLTQDLQDAALGLRMVPVEGLFQRVERVIRETADQLGKRVTVSRQGDEVSLDKFVLEHMLDPLIHLARNAVDHGIEKPAERRRAGKAEDGQVRLSAETTSDGVTLVFEDDGSGIDPDHVWRKAVELGLVKPDTEWPIAKTLQLIFTPGLSTADQVSEISGRGMGMHVVSDVVSRLRGRVEVHSERGQRTRFTMTLPTNLSILNALIVRVNGQQYAIPNQDLAEVIDLGEMKTHNLDAGAEHAVDLRGRIVPLSHLAAFLDNRLEQRRTEAQGPRPGIVVQFRDQLLALAVDQVLGQQEIFIRPMIPSLAPVPFFGGSTILADGEPGIILNLGEMARRYFEAH
ncbi:MAG: chemotaxis protein CheA [Bdellovibrionales bacterium]